MLKNINNRALLKTYFIDSNIANFIRNRGLKPLVHRVFRSAQYIKLGGVAQLVRALEWHSRGSEFDSHHLQILLI